MGLMIIPGEDGQENWMGMDKRILEGVIYLGWGWTETVTFS